MGAEESKQLRGSLSNLIVTHVEETTKVLRANSHEVVVMAKMCGLYCTCKRLQHKCTQVPPWKAKKMTDRFVKECKEMSKLRHPNIVQFLGVCFDHSHIPSLIMELLPTSLCMFLEEYSNVPSYVKHSILLDIAVALLYLHTQKPPIIHKDLTIHSVLLTHSLKAKVSSPGVNAQSLLAVTPPTSLTRAPEMILSPGNFEHMPPEVCTEVPFYSTKLDIFSFGHLTIHTVLQKNLTLFDKFFPGLTDPQNMIYRTELDRRMKYIDEIKDTNPLKSLVVDCLQDDPDDRPMICNVLTQLETISSHSPLPYLTPMDVLQALEDHSSTGEADNTDLVAKTLQQSPSMPLQQKVHELEVQNSIYVNLQLPKKATASEKQPLRGMSISASPHSQLPRPMSPPRRRINSVLPREQFSRAVSRNPTSPSNILDPKLATLLKRQQEKIEENKPGDGFMLLEAALMQR